ncbi:hypothetical protein KV557_10010 [Kitasatospora aureofaciens]|uniref:hypothetical protein n=1 Tax=Kitasatospora aureofaciens TaxID=1894 RepID=UPI001C47D3AB|nr:hypothetical protein [Kitasatospora aureofaciens]MBV6697458.1 hypothetical protein [Kitasatospora aureofaciens]
MASRTVAGIMVPVRAVLDGSPVLARRLVAPAVERRATAAEEGAKADKAKADARVAQLAKLTGAAREAAQKAHADEDRTVHKERWSKRADAVGAAVVVALIGGPVTWSVVGPWVPAAVWSGLGLWGIAAMMHAPRAGEEVPAPEQRETTAPAAPATAPEDDGEWIQDSPDEAVLWALIRHTAGLTKQGTAAHLQAILEEARKRGEMTDWTVSDLAEELASYRVPVVEQKKLTIGGRQYNRAAVLLAALPEADPAPVPAIVQGAA